MGPQSPVRSEPYVHFVERIGVDGMKPTRAFGTDGGDAVLAEHVKVLGHGWLADPEVRPHRGAPAAHSASATWSKIRR